MITDAPQSIYCSVEFEFASLRNDVIAKNNLHVVVERAGVVDLAVTNQ